VSVSGIRYEVFARDPERVAPELCRLWRENLALASTPEAHFQWRYREAPEGASNVFVLCAGPADPVGPAHIIGATGCSVRRFQLGTDDVRAAVCGDLVVAREHRSLLPALRLVRAVREHALGEFAFGYGFPNDKAQGVLVRAGFRVLGKTTRYARVLRHASYLHRLAARMRSRPELAPVVDSATRHRRLARALAPVLDVARLVSGLPEFARARTAYRLVWLDTVDARFDELWHRARREYGVIGARTSAMLRWRYPKAEVAALVRRFDGALHAYALVERDVPAGAAHIRDVFGYKAALGPLFDLLLPAAWWSGAHSLSIRLLGAPYLASVLADRGFERRPEQRTVVIQVGRSHESLRARLEDVDAWHLLDLDEDT
jgi:hypothetical protein